MQRLVRVFDSEFLRNMSTKILLSVFIISLHFSSLSAQGIWATQLIKKSFQDRVTAEVELFRFGNTEMEDNIFLNWGDGTTTALGIVGNAYYPSLNLTRATYHGMHVYDSSGLYELSFVDSFLVEGVANIENSGQQLLHFKDTVQVFADYVPYEFNEFPNFLALPPDQNDFLSSENGEVKFGSTFPTEIYTQVEEFQFSIVPFPAEGYTPPPGELYMDHNILVWDKPVSPGVYALCVKVREFRDAYEEGQHPMFMGTAHWAVMVKVDSSMLVSTYAPSLLQGVLSVYPNPTQETLHLQLSHFKADNALLQVMNLQGQTLHQESLQLSPAIEGHEIDLRGWPAGVYVLSIQAEGSAPVVRKIVVE